MPYRPRSKAQALATLSTITQAEHANLRAACSVDANYWKVQNPADKQAFERFKGEVKTYYLFAQGRRCCYCSFELANDHSTFDAEHILDKSTHHRFMFELNNLAAACRPCNRAKSTKTTLINSNQPATVPPDSAAYRIVHPHLDEWADHLQFDDLNRIQPRDGSQKGIDTIALCNIATLNAARLSDYFAQGGSSAESLLRDFFRYKSRRKKNAC